ncbi:MAG: glycosyltransferase family 2 protein, partial [Candidatus Electrothrix sp. MAN1_4]|nr:glycosyltransferase family 2 protein [Candidatus Electrothrix sp. MAN1_4]
FLLIKKEFWEKLQGFDPVFFMYSEDSDLCLRGKKQGAKPIITPAATIIHYGGGSEPVRADKIVRVLKAKKQLIRRHWGKRKQRLGIFLIQFAVFSRMLVYRIVRFFTGKTMSNNWMYIWKQLK